jgi:hypothetical protein
LPPTLKIHPVINVSQLKEYKDGTDKFPNRPMPLTRPDPVAIEDSGAPVWEVENIIDHKRRGKNKRILYLVKWKGYPIHESTWEPIEHLDGALELVIEYNNKKKIDLGIITIVTGSPTYAELVKNNHVSTERKIIRWRRNLCMGG